MKEITAEKIDLYKRAFRKSLDKTADSGMSWNTRKAAANRDAALVSPSVAEAMSVVMIWRRQEKAVDPKAKKPFGAGEYYLINKALAWKTKLKGKHNEPNGRIVATPVTNDTATVKVSGVRIKKGYICDWYEKWFQENDKIYAKDKELAFALGCSASAFTNARNKMRDKGYEIEQTNGCWQVTDRPMDEERRQQIGELNDYLDLLALEVAEAKQKLDLLII